MNKTRLLSVLRLEVLDDRTLLSGNIIAYTFQGANQINGDVGGGYYIIDESQLATPSSYYGYGFEWDLSGVGGAIDDRLGDDGAPYYIRGKHVFASNDANDETKGAGYIRYGDIGFSYDSITIQTELGTAVSAGQTLRSFVGGHSLSSLSSWVNRSPHTFIDSLQPLPFTIEDVFRHPKSLADPIANFGVAMEAEFTPTIRIGGADVRMRLEDVELLFGVDHFNWRQKVTEPDVWTVQIDTGGQLFPAPKPYVDPIQTPLSNYVITNEHGVPARVITDFAVDSAPYYFNEGGGGIADISNSRWTQPGSQSEPGRQSKPGSLKFYDLPKSHPEFNLGRLYTYFSTELVGVNGDGTEKLTGLGFNWRSNTTIKGGNAELINVFRSNFEDPATLPPDVTGAAEAIGVFRPEPGDGGLANLDGPPGVGVGGYITGTEPLNYSISFKNTASATDTTGSVVITQPLDADLDWSTFEVGDFGFGDLSVVVPTGMQSYSTRVDATATRGVYVDVAAGIDLNSGVATWTFNSIDPATGLPPTDPNVGFLPPNLSPPEGEGFVRYVIRAKSDLPGGTSIAGQATLIFDSFDPINTLGVANIIDAGPPTSEVASLPPTVNSASISLSWAGQDDAGGSGIATYDVFFSDNGAPYALLRDDTAETAATFYGRPGHTYSFYSLATDGVGHAQSSFTPVSTTIGGAAAGNKQTFTDDDGDIYTLLLSGPGRMEFLPDDPDLDGNGSVGLVILHDTDPLRSKLNVIVKKTVTGDGFVSIGAIEGNGLKSIAAVKSDVLGRIDLSGPLGSLRVRDIRGAAFIRTAGNATGKSTIVAHVIESGVAIEFATSVALFHAAAVGAGSISAPSIGILTVTGDARNRVGGVLTPIQGDFRANLSLTGTGDPRKPIALGLARIFGSVLDANWNVNGAANYIIAKNWIGGSIVADSLGTLWIKEDFSGDLSLIGNGVLPGKPVLKSASIGRAVEGSDIQIGGTVNKFIAGAMIDCALFVGFTPTDSGDPFAGGIFKLGARLNLFRVVGIKGVPEPAFENSIVAATLFGTVSFKSINPTNSTRFGLLADIGFENLAIGAPIFKLKKINTTPILDPVFGDFEISVI